ncbi:MAG: hypothetical protein HEQ22_15465 [Sphingopyxis sp.]
MPINEFDYSDAAIALRVLARLQQADDTRQIALDALWLETRERALYLYFGVCCRLNADRVRSALAALDAAVAGEPGFRSTAETPVPAIEEALGALLALLGLEPAPAAGPATDLPAAGEVQSNAASDKPIFAPHVISDDMRTSRFAGTGRGGAFLSPLEDAIRRFTAMLDGGSFLNDGCNDGEPVFVSKSFGHPELIATHAYVDYCLEGQA